MTKNKPILCIAGPTAAGKTKLAIELSKRKPIEIISVDSALVYRGLDIGSGKPSVEEQTQVPHHLIDIREPYEPYSAANFVTDACHCIEDIYARGKEPVLVGGTMMYFKALLSGLSDLPSASTAVRERLLDEIHAKGLNHLYDRLALVDPIAAKRIKPNDSQRIQRALEVYEITGQPMSDLYQHSQNTNALPYPVRLIAIAPLERQSLHRNIEIRFHQMLEAGLIDEVKQLRTCSLNHKDLPAIRSVGYRQVWQYLEGELSYDDMVEKAIVATRQLAKRQLTWLRNWPGMEWLTPCEALDNLLAAPSLEACV